MPSRPKSHEQRERERDPKANTHRYKREKRNYREEREERGADPINRQLQKLYSSGRWQRLRRMILSKGPLCADPFGDHERQRTTVPAKEIHHIVKARDGMALFYDLANLQPLCRTCHSARDRGH